FQGEHPVVEHRPQRGRRKLLRAEVLSDPPVQGLQAVQRCLGLRDLHLGGGHATPLGALGEPAGEERLAGALLAADRLEHRPAVDDGGQLRVNGGYEPVEADGEDVEPVAGDGAPAQGVDDLAAAALADLDRHGADPSWNWSRSSRSSRITVCPSGSRSSTGYPSTCSSRRSAVMVRLIRWAGMPASAATESMRARPPAATRALSSAATRASGRAVRPASLCRLR